MDNCPACGTPYQDASAKFCSSCGKPRKLSRDPLASHINRCTNKHCDNYDAELGPEEHYCSLCGSITTFGQIVGPMV